MWLRSIVVAILMAAAVAACPLHQALAQFEELEVHAGYTHNINRVLLHDTWDPGFGPELAITTPFYFGYIEGVAAYHMYDARVNDVPPFNALMVQLGWGVRADVLRRLRLEAGVRLGNYGMQFQIDDGRVRSELSQSELHMALQSRAAVRIYGSWSVHASASFQRTYVRHYIDLAYVSFGISRRFSTPSWLRDFLQ